MRYISTRGRAEPTDFLGACLAGLAPDGGLYVPETYPQIEPARPRESYLDLAARILTAFAGDSLSGEAVHEMCARAYGRFGHHSVAPLVQMGPGLWGLELHHGPTLAFKDVAMQLIAELYAHTLSERGERMSIVCATSGDTGGAAASAFAGMDAVSLTILHPHERISPVQRRFMTTTGAGNVHNLALEGDFDDCQALVKALFADDELRDAVRLSGVNSINWARIAAQAVYYAAAQAALGPGRALRFVVPTGNMGDALAGYVAARCGLLAGFEAVSAVNQNAALVEVFEKGRMRRTPAHATPSPAMDISVPSNLERLLFDVSGRDSDEIARLYARFAQAGDVELPATMRGPLGCTGLSAISISDDETLSEIARVYDETGWLICPHTAVGMAASRTVRAGDAETIVLATAHPAKFPETVEAATGIRPEIPSRLRDVADREERFTVAPADLGHVRRHLQDAHGV